MRLRDVCLGASILWSIKHQNCFVVSSSTVIKFGLRYSEQICHEMMQVMYFPLHLNNASTIAYLVIFEILLSV